MLSIAPNLSNLNYHSRNNSYFLTHKEFLGLSLNNALSLSHSQASVLSLFFYYSESSSPNYLLEEKNNILNDQEEKKFGWTDKTVSQIQAQLFKTKSRATVGKHIKSLEDHGWLESCPSALHKQGKQYRVNLKLILRNLESSPELVTSFCEKKKISDYKYQNSQNKTEFTNFSKIHNKYLSAHQGLVALSGSLEGGFVLSYFLQLANNLEDRNEYLNEEHGNFKSLIESKILYGWISKSQAQIKKAIGLKVHHSRVTALFKTLIEKNWLDKIDRRKERKNNLYRINIVKIIHDLKKAKLSYLNLEDNFELVKDLFERIGIQEESAKEKDGLPSAWKPSRQRTRTVSPAHKNSLASAHLI